MEQGSTNTMASNTPRRGRLIAVLAAAVLGIGFFMGRNAFQPIAAAPEEKEPVKLGIPAGKFDGWGNPELAIVLSGQTFGYLQPCGCSYPQYGGLTRRYNLVKMLEKKNWKVVGIDLGEIYPPKADLPEQAREKFKTTLRAQDFMNYQDFGLGVPEFKMPLVNGLAEMLALGIKKPRPISLDLKDPNKLFENLSVRSYDIIADGKTKVGVSSVVGPTVAKQLAGAQGIEFFPTQPMIAALLPALAKNQVDVVVLLVHGDANEAEEIAKLCFAERQKNPSLPNVDLIIHTSEFDTPPARPQLVQGTNTRAIYMGHKGKDVGVLGLFRKPAGGFELKYELIQLGPSFDTPKDQLKGHPVMELMETYSTTVKDSNFLDLYKALRISHPTQRSLDNMNAGVQAKYVGTEVCAGCHQHAFKVWEKSGHSHAFKTLEDIENPKNRQYDPECVMCHTVGFKYRTGYYDPPAGATAQQIEKHNKKLINVGCESCHGPGSMHANNPKNAEFYPLINPIKGIDNPGNPNARILADRFCQGCHDIENDVHWNAQKFDKAWQRLAHPTPKDE